jgi:hypothetical protein
MTFLINLGFFPSIWNEEAFVKGSPIWGRQDKAATWF